MPVLQDKMRARFTFHKALNKIYVMHISGTVRLNFYRPGVTLAQVATAMAKTVMELIK